jgi:hypothetical protein
MSNQPPNNQNPSDDSKPPSQKIPVLPNSQRDWCLHVDGSIRPRRNPRRPSIHLFNPSKRSLVEWSNLSTREQIVSCLAAGWFSCNAITLYFSTHMVMPRLQQYVAMPEDWKERKKGKP